MKKLTALDIDGLWLLLDNGRAGEVLAALGPVSDSDHTVARTLSGLAHYELGDHAAARADLEAVLAREAQNPVARLFLALVLFELGEDTAAGEALGAAVLHPHRGFLFRFLATFWPLRFTTSLGKFERVESALPVLPPPPMQVAELREDEEAVAGVTRIARELTTAEGKEARRLRAKATSLVRRGSARYLAGKPQEARALFTEAQAIAPESEEVASHFAYVELVSGDPAVARRALEPVVAARMAAYEATRQPEALPRVDTLVCYAWALHEGGLHEDALGVLSLVHPEGPEDYGSHYVACLCWLMLARGGTEGATGRAREAFAEAIGPFYIDTWEHLLKPFVGTVGRWLRAGGRQAG